MYSTLMLYYDFNQKNIFTHNSMDLFDDEHLISQKKKIKNID